MAALPPPTTMTSYAGVTYATTSLISSLAGYSTEIRIMAASFFG
jgi:hypothetical protein